MNRAQASRKNAKWAGVVTCRMRKLVKEGYDYETAKRMATEYKDERKLEEAKAEIIEIKKAAHARLADIYDESDYPRNNILQAAFMEIIAAGKFKFKVGE